jgi:putative flippase GtrA
MKPLYDVLNSPRERLAGNIVAGLAGAASAVIIYYLLVDMFGAPQKTALIFAAIIGAIQYHVFRYILLVGGGRKVPRPQKFDKRTGR